MTKQFSDKYQYIMYAEITELSEWNEFHQLTAEVML